MRGTRCVLGFSVHTGWAACVAATGSLKTPHVALREEIDMLGEAERFVFHRAAKLALPEAQAAVERAEKEARAAASRALVQVLEKANALGLHIAGCAIVAREGPRGALEEVLAAHLRIHSAEGCFYRDVLRAAANENRIAARVFPPKELERIAAEALRVPVREIGELLSEAGSHAGRPWGKDQKAAALAAWTLLAS